MLRPSSLHLLAPGSCELRPLLLLTRRSADRISRARSQFLPQLEHEAYGAAVDKLRYIQLVFKQCGGDLDVASRWLVSRGTAMLTPQQALDLAHLELKYPSATFEELSSLLNVLGTPERSERYLAGDLELSPYEEMQLEITRERAIERADLRIRDPASRSGVGASVLSALGATLKDGGRSGSSGSSGSLGGSGAAGSGSGGSGGGDGCSSGGGSKSLNVFKKTLERKMSSRNIFSAEAGSGAAASSGETAAAAATSTASGPSAHKRDLALAVAQASSSDDVASV